MPLTVMSLPTAFARAILLLLVLTSLASCGLGIGADSMEVPLRSKEVTLDMGSDQQGQQKQILTNNITTLNHGIFNEVPLNQAPGWLSGLRLDRKALHTKGVIEVYPLDPDGVGVLSVDEAGELVLWNVKTGESALFGNLDTPVTAVDLDPVGGYLAVVPAISAKNRRIRIWSLFERAYVRQLDRLSSRVTSVDFEPPRFRNQQAEPKAAVILGGADGKVYRWRFLEAQKGRILSKASRDFEKYIAHSAVVSSVAYHPGGRVFFSGDWNGAFNAWLAFDTDAFGGRYDKNIFGTGFFTERSTRRRAKRGVEPIEQMAVDPSGRYIALGLQSGKVEIWSSRGLVLRNVIEAHSGAVTEVQFGPEGKSLATYGRGDKLAVWKLTGSSQGIEQQFVLEVEQEAVLAISGITAFRYLGPRKIVAGTAGGKVLEIDIDLAKMKHEEAPAESAGSEVFEESSAGSGGA